MDKLQAILASKKTAKSISNREIIQKEKQQFLTKQQEQRQKEETREKKRLKQIEQFYGQPRKMQKKDPQVQLSSTQTLELTPSQIKIKLRQFGQPITLFGQDDKNRLARYKKILQFREKYPDGIDPNSEFHRKLKEAEQYEQLNAKFRSRLIQPRLMDDLEFRNNKRAMIQSQKENSFDNICDQIFLWVSKVLKQWGEKLQQKYNSVNNKVSAKQSFERYQETKKDLNTFLKVLKNRGGDKQMIESIYHIMNCCLVRQYVQANDKYIELSIGSAPWPMGVAMLGITVKRNAQRLAHVLNDQITRRWMLGIKRLISVSQQLFANQQKLKMVGYSITSMI